MSTNSHQEFPITSPITVGVKLGSGQIEVTPHDQPMAVVDVAPYDDSSSSRSAAENTKVELVGSTLSIETPESRGFAIRWGGRVRITLRVPADTKLEARTGSADIHIDGRLAGVAVKTGSGDVRVSGTAGDLSIESGSGDIAADEVGGTLRANTGSGDIRLGTVNGEIYANTSSGDVTISASAGSVHASSASGDVRIGAVSGPEVAVQTASGDVMVGIPAGTRVWLDVSTVSGSTRSDLTMSPQTASPETAPGTADQGATTRLHLHTASGDITLRRVATAAA